MIMCYMPEDTGDIIKTYLKDIQLNNAQKKWINEMLKDPTFIPLHRLKYLYYNFGLNLDVIEEFEDNHFPKCANREERYRRCQPYIKQRLNNLMWLLAGKGDIKIDHEYRTLYFKNLVLTWDEFGLYLDNQLIAYLNQKLENIVEILEAR